MPAQPTNEVIWDTNDTDTTAPTSGEQTDGLVNPSTLSRQKFNWLFSRISSWLRFLWQSIFRPADVYADQISRAHSDPPGTGSGLGPVAAGDFAARVFVNGMAVGPVDSPAHTYAASSDTYWDLDEDGLWTAAAVSNGAGAPALTANSVRCFMVVTDGADRTAVTDYSPAHVTVDQPLRLQGGTVRQLSGTEDYELIDQHQSAAGSDLPVRVYHGGSGSLYGADCRVVATNAEWDSTGSVWNRDGAGDAYLNIQGNAGTMVLFRDSADSDGWADAINASTGWTSVLYVNDLGHSFLETYGDLTVGGTAAITGAVTASSTVTASNVLYGSRLARTKSINGAAGACNYTGSAASGYDLISFGQGIQTSIQSSVSYALDAYIPDGAIITAITINGSVGSAATTRVFVSRIDKSTSTISYFKAGTTYDSFTNQAYLSAMSLTLDAAFASTAIDQSTYSYFVFIQPQSGQDGGSVVSVDVDYTVAGPD